MVYGPKVMVHLVLKAEGQDVFQVGIGAGKPYMVGFLGT